jgi:hypothetical protein
LSAHLSANDPPGLLIQEAKGEHGKVDRRVAGGREAGETTAAARMRDGETRRKPWPAANILGWWWRRREGSNNNLSFINSRSDSFL